MTIVGYVFVVQTAKKRRKLQYRSYSELRGIVDKNPSSAKKNEQVPVSNEIVESRHINDYKWEEETLYKN